MASKIISVRVHIGIAVTVVENLSDIRYSDGFVEGNEARHEALHLIKPNLYGTVWP